LSGFELDVSKLIVYSLLPAGGVGGSGLQLSQLVPMVNAAIVVIRALRGENLLTSDDKLILCIMSSFLFKPFD
jgi:hypothetical protein